LLYLLRLWSGTKTKINYKIDEIKELLMLDDKYDRYNDFKRRVIEPAIKELNNTGYFDIDINENKVGRKVESIDFIVKDLDKRVYFDKLSETKTETVNDKTEIELNLKKDMVIASNKSNYIEKNKSDDFYVPNKKLFTTKTLADFINDFSNYNFKEKEYKKILQESILIALEKDDEEKIKVKSYNYFKKTLENKLNNKQSKTIKTPTVKTRFHNINQTFNQYSPDELEKILLESQKDKFK
jgi:plasmid replication initiation protein